MSRVFNGAICVTCGNVTFTKRTYERHKSLNHEVILIEGDRMSKFDEKLEKEMLEEGR